jgi:sacsin
MLLQDDGAAGLGTTDASGALAGRAFCFLPLPAATGLPAHINGYFELSSNRRDVWHGSDMAGAGRLRAQVGDAGMLSASQFTAAYIA